MRETLFGHPNTFPAFDTIRPTSVEDAHPSPLMTNYVADDLLPHAFIRASRRRLEIGVA